MPFTFNVSANGRTIVWVARGTDGVNRVHARMIDSSEPKELRGTEDATLPFVRPNGDAVVRYDQLAQRWLYVMPIFRRDPNNTAEPFAMCYAVSTGADPLGPYYRYEFRRKLFPDYPRPAVWPDGYYNPTSTGDDVIQKHACVVDRAKMLVGQPATEQCVIIDGVNFLNNADIDGQGIPPAGAPRARCRPQPRGADRRVPPTRRNSDGRAGGRSAG